jgi:hypothetical protein
MKAGIFFTGSGPIVIVTSHDSFEEPTFVKKLAAKGLDKFIAYEVPVEEVKNKYGKHFSLIMNDLHQTDDLRVMDYDGHRVFNSFMVKNLGEPLYHEPLFPSP